MPQVFKTVTRSHDTMRESAILQTNSVIRNTYILLSMTLIFSAFTAWLSTVTHAQPMGLGVLILYFGLVYLTQLLRNSIWGIVSVFALTGLLGYTLGPLLNFVLHGFSNGSQLVMTSLGLTGAIFFALSGYALTTRKDFSYMGGFLFVAMTVLMIGSIVGFFFTMPIMSLMISCGFVLFSSAMILYETSQIIHGGERNYIMATIALYASLYNLFVSLLQILAIFGGRRSD